MLVDYHMPEMTGNEVADAIKHMKLNVPVVMVSSDDEIPEAMLGAVDGFVSKEEVGNLLLPLVLSFCGGEFSCASRKHRRDRPNLAI